MTTLRFSSYYCEHKKRPLCIFNFPLQSFPQFTRRHNFRSDYQRVANLDLGRLPTPTTLPSSNRCQPSDDILNLESEIGPTYSPSAPETDAMATCQPCGRLPSARPSRSKITCPPCPPCPPCACTIPVISEDLPKYQVTNPCDPNRPNEPDCCNVCVPMVVPKEPEPPQKPKKKCKYVQPSRPQSFAPQRKYLPPELKMDDDTIYKKSYIPVETDRQDPIRPSNNLCLGEGKMSDNTVNRMSYQPHKINPVAPVYPCEHKLIGEGPMQDLTTQKHDYVPKPYVKPEPVRPLTNLFTSDCPLSDKTVNRLSYQPVKEISKVEPVYPTNAIEKPTGKFSDKTVQKMSYQPWEPPEPMDMPWKKKPEFVPPKLRMEDNTVQKMSYGPPGQYVECADDDPDCVDCPEPPCVPPSNIPPPCEGPKVCCNLCCCPRASC